MLSLLARRCLKKKKGSKRIKCHLFVLHRQVKSCIDHQRFFYFFYFLLHGGGFISLRVILKITVGAWNRLRHALMGDARFEEWTDGRHSALIQRFREKFHKAGNSKCFTRDYAKAVASS